MDGAKWAASDDLYNAFFHAVGAPTWHGRNFNAVRDSIAVGRINRVEVPYLIRIKNYTSMGSAAKSVTQDFVEMIKKLQDSGCPVDIAIED